MPNYWNLQKFSVAFGGRQGGTSAPKYLLAGSEGGFELSNTAHPQAFHRTHGISRALGLGRWLPSRNLAPKQGHMLGRGDTIGVGGGGEGTVAPRHGGKAGPPWGVSVTPCPRL